MTRPLVPRRRLLAGAGVALALVGASLAAAAPLEHVPVYRYYVLARTDTAAHPIVGTFHYESTHRESFAVEWVMETSKGRRYVFDRAWTISGFGPRAAVAGERLPGCGPAAVCDDPDSWHSLIQVEIPVWFDYFVVTRDATATVDLSTSPDKNWVFTELKGDPRVTGRLHVLWPGDGDVTNVNAAHLAVQRIRDIGHPGGRYGSIATALAPYAFQGIASVGSVRLDGGQRYTEGRSRIDGQVRDVSGSHMGPTHWRLHGDLTRVGVGGGPTLLVYDLPEPKALGAYLRGVRRRR